MDRMPPAADIRCGTSPMTTDSALPIIHDIVALHCADRAIVSRLPDHPGCSLPDTPNNTGLPEHEYIH